MTKKKTRIAGVLYLVVAITGIFSLMYVPIDAMKLWTDYTIPKNIDISHDRTVDHAFIEKKLTHKWYKAAFPLATDKDEYQITAINSLKSGDCFCLSSLVQGMKREVGSVLFNLNVPSTQVWGNERLFL
jgi:hypothetical protein